MVDECHLQGRLGVDDEEQPIVQLGCVVAENSQAAFVNPGLLGDVVEIDGPRLAGSQPNRLRPPDQLVVDRQFHLDFLIFGRSVPQPGDDSERHSHGGHRCADLDVQQRQVDGPLLVHVDHNQWDIGLRIADCGLRIADCGFRIVDVGRPVAFLQIGDQIQFLVGRVARLQQRAGALERGRDAGSGKADSGLFDKSLDVFQALVGGLLLLRRPAGQQDGDLVAVAQQVEHSHCQIAGPLEADLAAVRQCHAGRIIEHDGHGGRTAREQHVRSRQQRLRQTDGQQRHHGHAEQ